MRTFKDKSGSVESRERLAARNRSAPGDYSLDARKRVVTVKFHRTVTVSSIARYAAALRADPLFKPDFSEIVDMSEVEELDLKPEEFIRLADEVDPFALDAKRAFVVHNKVQQHAARMHKNLEGAAKFRNLQIDRRRQAMDRAVALPPV